MKDKDIEQGREQQEPTKTTIQQHEGQEKITSTHRYDDFHFKLRNDENCKLLGDHHIYNHCSSLIFHICTYSMNAASVDLSQSLPVLGAVGGFNTSRHHHYNLPLLGRMTSAR